MVKIIGFVVFLGVVGALADLLFFRGRNFFRKYAHWAIGIHAGGSLASLQDHLRNPVLTAKYITDVWAAFVADPFIVHDQDRYCLFFEVLDLGRNRGEIGLAESRDGFAWKYKQIVLREPFHLSYPCVFRWGADWYMMPETREAQSVRLYRAARFPVEWVYVKDILSDVNYSDPTIFLKDGICWLYAYEEKIQGLRLFYSQDLLGKWKEHPQSPVVVGNKMIARPGGGVIFQGERMFRIAQDGSDYYGKGLRILEIKQLDEGHYAEGPAQVLPLFSSAPWDGQGKHHFSAVQYGDKMVAVSDGFDKKKIFLKAPFLFHFLKQIFRACPIVKGEQL